MIVHNMISILGTIYAVLVYIVVAYEYALKILKDTIGETATTVIRSLLTISVIGYGLYSVVR
jgi:hypothetical protein